MRQQTKTAHARMAHAALQRQRCYEAVADVTVATDGKNVTQICEEIIAKLIALDNEQENKQA